MAGQIDPAVRERLASGKGQKHKVSKEESRRESRIVTAEVSSYREGGIFYLLLVGNGRGGWPHVPLCGTGLNLARWESQIEG